MPFTARTCHAWLARLTRARGGSFLRGRKALLNDFWYFWSHKSTIKEKFLYVKDNTSSTAIAVPLLPLEKALYPLFLLHIQAQKKKLPKRKRRKEISRSAERDKSYALLTAPPSPKGGRKLYSTGENFDLNIKFAAKNKPRQCAADCFHYK